MAILATDAIQWHEGMLLLPQHFQQNDLRQRELLHFHVSQVAAFHWGVGHYAIDPVMLINGTLHFSALEAVMPDGLVISSYESEGEVVELDLTPYKKEMEKGPVMIYLAVPKYQYGVANASGQTPRFTSRDSIAVVDENTGEGNLVIPRMAPNVLLFANDEPPSTYVSFPLFKIERDSNAYVLRDYIAPTVKVKHDSTLSNLCTDICKQIREKIAFLSERLISRSTAFMSRDAEAAVRALSTGLLPFEAQLKSGASHPYTLYIGLCQLAGHVAGLHPAQIPPIFDPYNHNDLRESFLKVFDFISTMIDRIQEGYTIIPFALKDRTFSLKLQDTWFNKHFIIGAKAPPSMSTSELTQWVKESVIASESFVKTAMDNRVAGANRTIITSDEKMKLLPSKGVVLFSVDIAERFIKRDETLQIFNVSDEKEKRPVEIVLYVPKSTG